ncbi:SusC/RagA family TonB-linked outer membrane protein [Fulvivirgaceae bacterium BMA12]|uniref:SusC/RagA family TonB-linked outer membrane protein n=1 Tax=Agaribacillus aureus TaxID=3051825 RepID=A0ABT8LE84_9BACT|nr:SusC/RagA family TonB-linked outer membrane protein [Fulvivirgaceae bacterium BMA12]
MATDGKAQPEVIKSKPLEKIYVSIDIENKTLEDAFSIISKTTNFDFIYDRAIINDKRTIDATVKNKPLGDLLRQISRAAKVQFRRVDGDIFVQNKTVLQPGVIETVRDNNALGEAINIKGQVTSNEGEALIGVSIQIKGSTKGTITDTEGRFSLEVNENDVLIVSYIGYITEEVNVGGRSEINIVLLPNLDVLQEVVVVGYGTQEKKDLTGAISSVSAEDFNSGVVTSVTDLIVGKVAGLSITQNGSDPTRGATVQLRGPSTLGGSTAPFYVIDGIPGADLANIAAEDIESIDVLKDAASTAIYGTRASNGVIIVTTKKGKANETVVDFHAYGSVDKVARTYEMANAAELRAYLASRDDLAVLAEDDDSADTDWNDVVTRTGYSQNYNLSFSGGSEKSQYYASMTYLDQKGIVKTSDKRRVLARLRLNQQALDDRLRLGLNLSASNVKQSPVDYTTFFQVNNFLPITDVYEDDGVTYRENLSKVKYFNPLSLLETRIAEDKITTLTANATIAFDIFDGLTANASGSLEESNRVSGVFLTSQSVSGATSNGSARKSSDRDNSKIAEAYLNYDKTFGDHTVSALLGYSFQEDILNDGVGAANNQFLLDDLGFNGLANGNAPDGFNFLSGFPSLSSSILESVYGRVNYSFKDRYYFQASLRRDGSSVFGTNNKRETFPGVSVAWRISDENFMSEVSFLTNLKLRAGYGETGFQFINPYQSLARFGQGGRVLVNGAYADSYFFVQNANPDLKWETTSTTNVGFDFELLEGRIFGTFDWYTKTTSDMLDTYSVSVPPFPVGSIFANAGEMENKGFEISIGAAVIDKGDLKWTTNFVLDRNVNKLVSLSNEFFEKEFQFTGSAGGRSLTGVSTSILLPGHPVGVFNTFKWVGYDETGKHTFEKSDGSIVNVEELSYPEDAQIVGDPWPDFQFGWSNSVNYKNFTLDFTMRGRVGNEIMNTVRANLSRIDEADQYNVLLSAIEDGGNRGEPSFSSFWIESGTFVRMENIRLNYQLPRVDFLKNAMVYVAAQNLFTITDFSGVDPDINLSGKAPAVIGTEPINSGGVDIRASYYKARSFVFGVRLTL